MRSSCRTGPPCPMGSASGPQVRGVWQTKGERIDSRLHLALIQRLPVLHASATP